MEKKNFTLFGAINFALKHASMTLGLLSTGTKKGADKMHESFEYAKFLDEDGHIDNLYGDGKAQDYIVTSALNTLTSKSVSLNEVELAKCEKDAREFAEESGGDYDVVLAGMKASALELKKKTSDKS